ncbi:shikimate dehydrogenase [Chungangia koreensis]|uniref:Shikimate dehydrogenase (NADP(+)) n=1 Tax=Chungangia koreensis TaxID=752657 RepID=A0ABV8X542_9LACT
MKKWFGVIGDPISHSLSPFMHDQWFRENHLDATYLPIRVSTERLGTAVESLRLLGASGWNVTIPHKTSIIPFLDGLDPMASKMGAVNTVVRNEKDELIGYNTDGLGFVRSLEEEIGLNEKQSSILVIGAGGAARGIVHALSESGYEHITIANRTIEKASLLIDEIGRGEALSLQEAEIRLSQFHIIIQTTSAGMKTDQAKLPLSMERMRSDCIAADIVYNPLETPFLKIASEKGGRTISGIGMFVHQGAIAFNYWTGIEPDTLSMKQKVTEHLGGKYVNR